MALGQPLRPAVLAATLLLLPLLLPPGSWRNGLLCGTAAADGADRAVELMACFKQRDCPAHKTTWDHFTDDRPSCLSAVRVWWSPRPAGLPVTLVTQLSADRLTQLQAQCRTWAGPLAAALYVPVLNPTGELSVKSQERLRGLERRVQAMVDASEAGGAASRCQLRLVLMYEVFADAKSMALYPVNSLRNYARLLADTDLITNIDVDMIPSASISTSLVDPAVLSSYAAEAARRQVYVFPAFETRCSGPAYADTVAVSDKALLPGFIKEECVGQMRGKVAPACHNATLYHRWFSKAEGSKPYAITYSETFEPWYLSARASTAWFDFRYRGYGKNKIVQSAAMNASGFGFNVFPSGFLVHRPHSESQARKQFIKAKFSRKDPKALKGSVYEHVEALWAETQRQMAAGTYVPALEEGFKQCARSLTWWRATLAEGLT